MIMVAVIDDNRLVRDALAAMLDGLPDIRAVAAGVAAPAFLAEHKPDVLLLDVGLGDDDSLRVAADLANHPSGPKIVIMDLIPMHEDIAQFVNAGVSGFVLKDATFDEFVAT